MVDPQWSTRFQPVVLESIPLLAKLLRVELGLLDELLSKKCINERHYTELSDARKRESDDVRAQSLFGILCLQPEPSFATFCGVLLQLGERAGQDLYHLLTCEELTVTVKVAFWLEELYRLHEAAFITAFEDFLQKKFLPRRVRIVNHLWKRSKRYPDSIEWPHIHITLPKIDRQRFELERKSYVFCVLEFMNMHRQNIYFRTKADKRKIIMIVPETVFVDKIFRLSDRSQEIYVEALKRGSVTVNRSRIIVAGQDGAGKSCFVDSLLNRLFEEDKPSTEGAAVALTHTETSGWVASERADHLDPLIAEAVYRLDAKSEEAKEAGVSECYCDSPTSVDSMKPAPAVVALAEKLKLKAVGVEAKTLTTSQKKLTSIFLAKKPSEEDLSKQILGVHDIWDLGGQEVYLATHSALMPGSKAFGLTMYMIVMDISKSLSAKAESFHRSSAGDEGVINQKNELGWIRTNGDFPLYWFGSITAAHEETPMGDHFLGRDEEVAPPPVFAIGSHRDVLDCDKNRFPDSESVKDWLKEQGKLFEQLLEGSDFVKHIVIPKKDGVNEDDDDDFREMTHFFKRIFLIDNSVSGSEHPCKGVKEIRERVDRLTKTYWKGMKKQPLFWVYLEILLFRWSEVMRTVLANVDEIAKLAKHPAVCNISNRDEVLVALKYLASVGAILYYPEVDGLKDVVFTRPMWVIKSLSAFVTAAEPGPFMMPAWNNLKQKGIMSNELLQYRLEQMRKTEDEYLTIFLECADQKQIDDDNRRIIRFLELLDVIAPVKGSSQTNFYVPSMLKTLLLYSPTYWERLTCTVGDVKPPCYDLPAPLIVIPKKLKFVPECLFFRLITRFLKMYPNRPRLSRHQCIFLVQDRDSPVQGMQQSLTQKPQ